MQIVTKTRGHVLWAHVDGELDLVAAEPFRQEIQRCMEREEVRHLILVMNGVTFVDSSGLGVILGRYREIQRLGGRMAVVGLKPQVQRNFALSGLHKILEFYEAENDAQRAIGG